MMLMDPSYSKQQKEFAIRRSLTGSAARLVMHQGMEKPIDQIMEVLDSVYGTIDNKEQLLAEFYSARQREDEDVTTWSNRLQDILGKGLGTGIVSHQEMNSMLHAMLWTGLRQELKDISGYKYDTIKDFNQLRVALRQLEKDHQPKKTKPNTAKAATTTIKENTHDYEELKGMVQQLTHQFTELRQQQQQPQEQLQQQPQQQYYRGNNFRGNRGNNRGRGRGGQWYNNQQGQQAQQGQQQQNYQQGQQQKGTYQQNPILCRRCGQEGHIQIGCRVRLDHTRQDLKLQEAYAYEGPALGLNRRTSGPKEEHGARYLQNAALTTPWTMSTKILCGPCGYEDNIKHAKKWCTNCDEGFCEDCEKVHRSTKMSRNHTLISVSDYQKIKDVAISQTCVGHGKRYDLYCSEHDKPLCLDCVDQHKSCSQLVSLDAAAANAKQSTALADLEDTINGALQNVGKFNKNLKTIGYELNKQERLIKKNIQEIREKLNKHLDALEQKLIQDLSIKTLNCKSEHTKAIHELNLADQKLSQLKEEMMTMKQMASDVQVFLGTREINKTLSEEIKTIKGIIYSTKYYEIKIEIEGTITSLLDCVDSFGMISVVERNSELEFRDVKLDQAQKRINAPSRIRYRELEAQHQQLGIRGTGVGNIRRK
ncbi:Hypothetical predicted protein [Mytilus galloprovincialis]|uniref:CCHC-type domain-containing protein n=1 Tax=Mytilus galloprovincialis TaxID=29158 RepID=A0A8B6CR18_MYTGA|nr:Hypothetical predicted protein [Mytilus galloprovincialis]